MRVISLKRLREFWEKHPDSERPLRTWHKIAELHEWSSLSELRVVFPSADVVRLKCNVNVVVFNVGGNKYRLIVRILYREKEFKKGFIYVKRILTHADYDRIDWKGQICREQPTK